MGLIFQKDAVYEWPVTFTAPDPDKPGRMVSQTFTFQWELASTELTRNPEQLDSLELTNRAVDELREKLHGWDISDGNGTDIPFTQENAEDLIFSKIWATNQIVDTWLKCSSGEARKKKSGAVR